MHKLAGTAKPHYHVLSIGYLLLWNALGCLVATGILTSSLSAAENEMTIKRHYAYAGDRRIHYRRAGSGPPLVMLHASPGSSAGLLTLIGQLAKGHTVIAIDSPDYGESGPMGVDRPDMADYANALGPTLDALNLGRVDLYGTHTGGKIALQFAVQSPERVRRLVLDGVGIYTAEERESRIANYTPSLEPQWDGSHLIRTWAMRREMIIYAPWYDRSAQGRRLADLRTPAQLHEMAVDFLRAGAGYWRGYQAAFRYDTKAALKDVSLPTLLVALPGDSLREHLSRLDQVSKTVRVAPSVIDSLADHILQLLADDPLADAPPPPPVTPQAGVVRRDYVDASVGQLLMRRVGGHGKRPVVLLHSSPTSSKGLEPLLLDLGADRPAVTFDNPGNGDSAPLPGKPEIRDLAKVIVQVIGSLGFEDYDLYGTHTGALIAMEVAIADQSRVRHLILDGVTMFSEAETRDLLSNHVQPMRISWDGSQLLWAWNFLRDGLLWWPWYDRTAQGARVGFELPNPEALHERLVEFIKGGTTYHLNTRAAFAYPTRERLPLLSMPVFHCATETDMLAPGLAEAGRVTRNAKTRIIPGRGSPEDAAETVELYRRFLADQSLPGEQVM